MLSDSERLYILIVQYGAVCTACSPCLLRRRRFLLMLHKFSREIFLSFLFILPIGGYFSLRGVSVKPSK